MTFGMDDAPTMLADMGEDVTIGGVTAKGLFRRADEVVLEGDTPGTIAKTTHVVVQRGVFPALAIGVAVTVAGQSWVAREPLDLADPRLTRVELRKG